MTSMTRQYSAAASHARNAVEKTADVWTEGARTVTNRLPGLPQVDLVPAVNRYFDLVQRAVDMNRRVALRWAEAAGTLSGVVREKAESAGDIMRDKAEAAGEFAREQAAKAEQAAGEQAAKAEQVVGEQAAKAEQAVGEQAAKAQQAVGQQAAKARERARQRYEGLPKAELSDLLAKRDLPKTGNVDELIERLVEADSR